MDITYNWNGFSKTTSMPPKTCKVLSSFTQVQHQLLQDCLLDDEVLTFEEAVDFISQINLTKMKLPKAKSQSEAVEEVGATDTSKEMEQNVQFADAEEQIDLKVGMMSSDLTFNQGLQENAQLAAFLSRPIEVFRREWTVNAGTPFVDVFNPWQLFLNDARVLNKLETFKLLHGTLKLKFLINGSPYHYGRVFVGCRPTRYDNNMSQLDLVSSGLTVNYNTNTGTPGVKSLIGGRTFYSQRPHIFIDPATNQPSHIDWPFFAATNFLDLNDPNTVDRLGRIEMWELNTLQHNNNATDPLTITVFAWMEDVTLTGLTSTAVAVSQSEMTVTSGKKAKKSKKKTSMSESKNKDEYQGADGVISGPASAVANYAAYFTEIPIIGKFARATHIAGGAVADVARLFGFSRPAIIDPPTIMRPQLLGNMAITMGNDPVMKLTLDPKQELTIDPSTAGLPGDDQMSIGYIAKKEALIDSFVWNNGQFADRRIYSIAVHPMVAPIMDTAPVDTYTQTPLSFVTLPFARWRGSLRYRFQIVASAFHRGRLAVVYEPSLAPSLNLDLNSRYVAILDLAEAKDFTIEVKWSQAQAYCQVEIPAATVVANSDFPAILAGLPQYNGIIQVYVINELASSITTSSVDVNVYISAGDDYQVQMPRDRMANIAYARNDITPGPPAFSQSEVITQDENDPTQDTTMILNGSYCPCDPNSNLVYFGEQIVSIRSLMKRYNFHRPLVVDGLTADQVYLTSFIVFNFPTGPGPTYGSSLASPLTPIPGGASYNVCAMTHIRYFAQGYIGWRGSIRYKAVNLKGQGDSGLIKVARSSGRTVAESVSTQIVRGTGVIATNTARRYLATGPASNVMEGFNMNSAIVNPSLEYELPLYNAFRYVEVNEPVIADATEQLKYQGNYNGGAHFIATTTRNVDSDSFGTLEMYAAIGEDFSFFFFIGASPYYDSDAGSAS